MNNPERVVETRYPQIPSVYLEKCQRDFEDSTIQSVIVGLDKALGCYETKQDSLRSWYEDLKSNKDE